MIKKELIYLRNKGYPETVLFRYSGWELLEIYKEDKK